MIEATIEFGGLGIETRSLETIPSIGDVVDGPSGSPWKIIGIVRRPDGVTLSCAPMPAAEVIRGDADFPLRS